MNPFFPAVPIVPLIVLSFSLAVWGRIYEALIYLQQRSTVVFLLYGLGAAANIVLGLVLIPRSPLYGAAAAAVVAYGLTNIGLFCVARKNFGRVARGFRQDPDRWRYGKPAPVLRAA
jgi:O-antigen/teichoic acid export membrane protein